MPPKKKTTSEGESQKKARTTTKKGRSEDDDAEKEVEQRSKKKATGAATSTDANPTCFRKLETTMKLDESARSFLLTALGYCWRSCEAETDPLDLANRALYFPPAQMGLEVTPCPKVHEYGADVIAPIITEWPGNNLMFKTGEITSSDLPIVMDAIAARSGTLMPMTWLTIHDEKLIDDAGALAIANMLHQTELVFVYLTNTKITEKGVEALLGAIDKMPNADRILEENPGRGPHKNLILSGIRARAKAVAKTAVTEWKAGWGKNSIWEVAVS